MADKVHKEAERIRRYKSKKVTDDEYTDRDYIVDHTAYSEDYSRVVDYDDDEGDDE